jgi:hypothetical protein
LVMRRKVLFLLKYRRRFFVLLLNIKILNKKHPLSIFTFGT